MQALSVGQVLSLDTAQINQGLSTGQIAALTTRQIAAFSTSQLQYGFSTEQLAALGTAGVGALKSSQVKALSTQQIAHHPRPHQISIAHKYRL